MDALSALYRNVLHDLSDRAFGLSVQAAMRTCKFFPTPAELLSLADAAAYADVYERIAAQEQARAALAAEHGIKLIEGGKLTPEKAEERAAKLRALGEEVRQRIRDAGHQSIADRREFWESGQRRAGRRKANPGRFDPPEEVQ